MFRKSKLMQKLSAFSFKKASVLPKEGIVLWHMDPAANLFGFCLDTLFFPMHFLALMLTQIWTNFWNKKLSRTAMFLINVERKRVGGCSTFHFSKKIYIWQGNFDENVARKHSSR